jgi:hypothetical protein
MEMVQSLIKMVSKLCDEVQQLRIGNADMKTQLREVQQLPSHAPTPAIATNAIAKTYRDVVCAEGGNPSVDKVAATVGIPLPAAPIVTGDDFVTVVRKKRFTPPPVNTAAVVGTIKKPRVPMIGVSWAVGID